MKSCLLSILFALLAGTGAVFAQSEVTPPAFNGAVIRVFMTRTPPSLYHHPDRVGGQTQNLCDMGNRPHFVEVLFPRNIAANLPLSH